MSAFLMLSDARLSLLACADRAALSKLELDTGFRPTEGEAD